MERGLANLRTRRRERELASAQRAGAWSRRQARALQIAFVRRQWRTLATVLVVAIAISPTALLLDERARWFALGVWWTAVAGILLHHVILLSGSVNYVMGDLGEQWTQQELRPLRRTGWRVIHRALFRRNEDIDTIAIGPAGVVVIETKWASKPWSSRDQQPWIHKAVKQATRNSALVERQIRQQVGAVTAWPVVAVWPSDPDLHPEEIDGVTVLPGVDLRRWIGELPPGDLDPPQVERAWRFIDAHLADRDARDLTVHGPPYRMASQYLFDAFKYPLGALLALGVVSAGATLTSGFPFFMLLGVVLAVSMELRRFALTRRFATGALVATAALVATYLILTVIDVMLSTAAVTAPHRDLLQSAPLTVV